MVYNNADDCYNLTHMNTITFVKLCDILRERGGLKEYRCVLVDEQVAVTLWILGHNIRNRVAKFDFCRSGETISRVFNRVLRVILRLQVLLFKRLEPIGADTTDLKWTWFQMNISKVMHKMERTMVIVNQRELRMLAQLMCGLHFVIILQPLLMASCKKWYVVFKGREPGVFDSWDACSRSVNGYSGNSYRSYQTLEEALFAYEKSLSRPQEPFKTTQIEGFNHERGDIELHATYAVPPSPLPPLRWILEARRHKGLN
ncbi:hypothetical protein Sjap_005109 [Stephania japonica]|uniref:Uncharacterized protein n=1 Tax=Stephania japonica TaxID=461633 RepID=A0AAP0K3N7_9MAGN